MRVISGKYGSRNLKAVPGSNTRPTTDKIKESIFNLIGGYFSGGYCLDYFAGSGALGIEAVSRGMEHAVLCEKYGPALQTIETNLTMTKERERFTLLKGPNQKALSAWLDKQRPVDFDLIFLDPPYHAAALINDIQQFIAWDIVSARTVIVCETDDQQELPERIDNFSRRKQKKYGQTLITIYAIGDH